METPKCFVIMPISDREGYAEGHFDRVYDYIIKPACQSAGFTPVRADDIQTTNFIVLDVIKNIIECEMAICDLSSWNPNVLYELGLRQAFDKPVTLIKDLRTPRIFDIQGIRDVPYDESLRIDGVEDTVESLAQTIRNTHQNAGKEVNSLVSLLGIEPAKVGDRKKISVDTELILGALGTIEKRLTVLEQPANPLPSSTILTTELSANAGEYLTQHDIESLVVGQTIFHDRKGKGVIQAVRGTPKAPIVQVRYDSGALQSMVIRPIPRQFRKWNA